MQKRISMRLTVPTLLLVCGAAAGCDSDRPIAPEVAHVEDSVLAYEVLSARGEDFKPVVEETVREDSASIAARAKALIATHPQPRPQRAIVAERKAPVALASAIKPRVPRVLRVAAKTPAPATVERRAASARAGIVARGSQVSLVVGSHVCNDDLRVGQTFRASVAAPVSGSNGVAIPEGAQAVAKITSVSEWGSGVGVTVQSVRIDGRSYPLDSPVTYVLPEKRKGDGVCIPQRTHIDVVTGQRLTFG